MEFDAKNIADMLKLQHLDLELMRARKQFEELPQRQQILEARKKKQAIEKKRDQISEMKAENAHEVSRLADEDERQSLKQQETQDKISSVKGDYRSVESYSKELNGISKRRVTLEMDLSKAEERAASIAEVEGQVTRALDQVETQEKELIASFQKEGGTLNSAIATLESERKALAAELPAEVMREYERAAKRSGGIAVARLIDARCSVCRNPIEGGKLIQVQAEAPLSQCPACKRLLVVG